MFRTNKLYDELQNEEARLYYPFIVTLSKSPVRLVYPFYYKAVSFLMLYMNLSSAFHSCLFSSSHFSFFSSFPSPAFHPFPYLLHFHSFLVT